MDIHAGRIERLARLDIHIMDCPKELSARDRLGATWLNGLVRFVRSLRLIQGPGVKLTRTPNGTIISVKRERKQPAEIVWPWTFKCTMAKIRTRTRKREPVDGTMPGFKSA